MKNIDTVVNEMISEFRSNSEEAIKAKPSYVSSEILRSLAAGEHSAFEMIYSFYFERVKYYISTMVNSSAISEELTQNIFYNLWQNRESVNPSKNFNAYIYTIARNTVYNYVKSRAVRERYVQNRREEDRSPDADDLILLNELISQINVIIARMPKQRRTIFELSRKEGLANDEIADMLNISVNAVNKQLRFAMQDIRKSLK